MFTFEITLLHTREFRNRTTFAVGADILLDTTSFPLRKQRLFAPLQYNIKARKQQKDDLEHFSSKQGMAQSCAFFSLLRSRPKTAATFDIDMGPGA